MDKTLETSAFNELTQSAGVGPDTARVYSKGMKLTPFGNEC
jgi:hypothetical protein